VAALTFDLYSQTGWSGNVGDQAEVDSFLLQHRPLLYVQLDELVEAPIG
jgi:hypothetical protein